MGQRSQIYIRYNINYTRGSATSNPTTENYRGLIARYYQWNYGERMISRARSIIETIKSEFMEYGFMWEQNCYLEKLRRICDVNFDMRDIVMSTDIIKEVAEECDCDCSCIFNQDNNDGQLLIDVTENGIKYCFIPFYNEIEVMNGRQYLVWDSRDSYDVYQWTETEAPKEIDKETKKYTLDNLDYITENAELMTKEEAEEFINADYSYLFAPNF